eukprot:PLAT14276.1.p2 GENE.PLAT14276.1~~PLAT14276.1.p2  ORF type:complete len:726 (+),score=412.68 PLAT14276.1:47-2224(+)
MRVLSLAALLLCCALVAQARGGKQVVLPSQSTEAGTASHAGAAALSAALKGVESLLAKGEAAIHARGKGGKSFCDSTLASLSAEEKRVSGQIAAAKAAKAKAEADSEETTATLPDIDARIGAKKAVVDAKQAEIDAGDKEREEAVAAFDARTKEHRDVLSVIDSLTKALKAKLTAPAGEGDDAEDVSASLLQLAVDSRRRLSRTLRGRLSALVSAAGKVHAGNAAEVSQLLSVCARVRGALTDSLHGYSAEEKESAAAWSAQRQELRAQLKLVEDDLAGPLGEKRAANEKLAHLARVAYEKGDALERWDKLLAGVRKQAGAQEQLCAASAAVNAAQSSERAAAVGRAHTLTKRALERAEAVSNFARRAAPLAVVTDAWLHPGLGDNWSPFHALHSHPAYMMNNESVVTLAGSVTGHARSRLVLESQERIAQLPEAFAPAGWTTLPVLSNHVFGRLDIGPRGSLLATDASNRAGTSLDGLSWLSRHAATRPLPLVEAAWANYDRLHAQAGFYKDTDGQVHLSGFLRRIADGDDADSAVIAVLPEFYRPQERSVHIAVSAGRVARVDVLPNGEVRAVSATTALSLAGIVFPVNGDVWDVVPLAGKWKPQPEPFEAAAFFKDAYGVVHLKGAINSGHVQYKEALAFTLPPHARPAQWSFFIVSSGDTYGRVDVFPDGRVVPTIGKEHDYISLAGVRFPTAASSRADAGLPSEEHVMPSLRAEVDADDK